MIYDSEYQRQIRQIIRRARIERIIANAVALATCLVLLAVTTWLATVGLSGAAASVAYVHQIGGQP